MSPDEYHIDRRRVYLAITAALAFIVLCVLFVGGCDSLNRPGPTQVALIRNGGPLDNKSIREVRPPNSNYAVSGLFSSVRYYIAGNEQRFYSISSDPSLGEKGGVDVISVPTQDGVQVGLDGTIYFRTAFTEPSGELSDRAKRLVEQFDTQYGNRTFPSPSGGSGAAPWDGNDGWNDWLDSIFRPVVNNAVRQTIGQFTCAQLVSSCALVQQNGGTVNLTAAAGESNTRNFQAVQTAINQRLQQDVDSALGGPYLRALHFKLVDVKLPPEVQGAINKAQSSFAQIAEARAQNKQAIYQARANERLAASYRTSPALAFIQAAKELKDSSATVILGNPGTGFNIGG